MPAAAGWVARGAGARALLAGGVIATLAAVSVLVLPGAGARAAARTPAAARAVGYLERAQNDDGGLGEAPREPSAQLFAGWAALGLASAGVDVATLRRASDAPTLLAYVRRGAGAGDTGSLERTILVLSAADAGAGPLVATLERRVSPAGSVSRTVNLTAFAVLALRASGSPGAGPLLRRCERWLIGQADRDGGYAFAGRGSQSDSDDTGAVLEALGRVALPGAARARRRAVAYLRRDQDRDGGFPAAGAGDSNAQSTAWVIQGLLAAGIPPSSLRRDGHTPGAYLDSLVTANGAVRYARGESQTPVWVTAEALMALTGTPLPIVGRTGAGSPRRPGVAAGSGSPGGSGSTSGAGAPGGSGSAGGAGTAGGSGAGPGATSTAGGTPASATHARTRRRARAGHRRPRHHVARRAAPRIATAVARELDRMQASVAALPRQITAALSLAR